MTRASFRVFPEDGIASAYWQSIVRPLPGVRIGIRYAEDYNWPSRECYRTGDQFMVHLGRLRFGFQFCRYKKAWWKGWWWHYRPRMARVPVWQLDFAAVFSVALRWDSAP